MPGIDPAIAALALWCLHRDGDGPTRTNGDEIIYGPTFEALPPKLSLIGRLVQAMRA